MEIGYNNYYHLPMPQGYTAISLNPDSHVNKNNKNNASLSVSVLYRLKTDNTSNASHLVVLRETIDATIYMGCLMDAGGKIFDWLEIWVQNPQQLAQCPTTVHDNLTNKALDHRWAKTLSAMHDADNCHIIETGWENEHPLPVIIDKSTLKMLNIIDKESRTLWKLCQDDSLLAAKGLPQYNSSLHRYLYLEEWGDKSQFVPLTENAPENEHTIKLNDVMDISSDKNDQEPTYIPFNQHSGLILVRSFSSISYEAYNEVLSGGNWSGLHHGRDILDHDGYIQIMNRDDELQHANSDVGRLFLGRHGKWGRIVESYHLKLRLLLNTVSLVRGIVEKINRPILNLSHNSISIKLNTQTHELPFLWTATPTLVECDDAVTIPIIGCDTQYYSYGITHRTTSIYKPEVSSEAVSGNCSLRIRQVLTSPDGITTIEGTFISQEKIKTISNNDLVWLRSSIGSDRVDMYVQLEKESSLAASEWRFRTLPTHMPSELVKKIQAAEGIPVQNVLFQTIPYITTAYDLYSLAVLAVRTLLVDNETSLPFALDEILSLTKQLSEDYDPEQPLSQRISTLFNQDQRWLQSLGPQHLLHEEISPQEVFDLIPSDLWWETLAMIVKAFPGYGPYSTCKDFGDASTDALHLAFDTILNDLNKLVLRSRSMIVIDWKFNREVHAVIRRFAIGINDKISDPQPKLTKK